MQRAARSIVPTDNREGLANNGADNSIVSNGEVNTDANASASQPARRRRGGRRVVRGTGAAGASLELQVQEHAAPLFEASALADPAKPEASDDTENHPIRRRSRRTASASVVADHTEAETDAVETSYDEDRPVRRRARVRHIEDEGDTAESRPTRRRRADDDRDQEDDFDRPVRRRTRRPVRDDRDDRDDRDSRRATQAQDPDERLLDAVGSLPEGHAAARHGKPMTSLLFQEPVLPATRRDDHDDNASDDEDEDIRPRRTRRSRNRDEEEAQPRTVRRRADHDDHDDQDDRDRKPRNGSQGESDEDEQSDSRRSRRSRRLNAQERRAAAEVEQIEEDLELDDISYAPIAEEEDDESDATRTRSRRRRRRGSRSEAASAAESNDSTERESDDESRSRRHDDRDRDRDEDDEDQTVTRRRRRRRGGKNGENADENGDQLIRRSRKQQYIDEITDVEGSTRLEAKKQRRRDNRRERSRQSQLMEQDFLARRENVDRLMVVREREHHTQISVVEDNILVEHYVSDIQEVQTVGNIYLGRVQNVLPSMEAAFVDIGQARNGVLYAGEVNWDAARLEGQPRRIELAFKSGDPVLVQVTKDPIGHKGARLTSQVTLAGRFLVLVPSGGMTGVSRKLSERERSRLKNIVSKIAPKDMGVIIRTAAEGASEDAIVKDLESLVRQWERINAKREEFWHGKRPKLLQGEPDVAIRVVRDIFNDDFSKLIVEGNKVYDRIEEYLETMAPDLKDKLEKWDPAEHEGKDVFDKWQIDSQLRKGMERQVYLPSGGSIVIDRTEAMTTIDVNTGRFIGKGKSLEETVTRCNLEASEEIARQLRLRDIGGMVMIDYVDMVMPANRDLVLRRLVECLARDRTKHQVAEVTSLGLVQMTRKRIGQGLVEAFSEECPTCKGRGFILHDQPTVSADYDDPYALRGGDPFVKTNKHGRGTAPAPEPAGSSADVKAKLAQIAAAAVAANNSAEA